MLWLTLARATHWRRPILATVIALLYACSDEYHQTFVAGRHGSPVDVSIDAIGMGLAALAWTLAARRRGRPGPPWPVRALRASGSETYNQPRSVAISTAWARSTAPSFP